MLANVLLPVTVSAPAPPWFRVGQDAPPPAKVLAEAAAIEIVAEPVMVRPVVVAAFQAVPLALMVTEAAVPKAMVRVLELEDESVPMLTVLPLKSMVPLVRVSALVAPNVRLSCSCIVPPTPFMVMGLSTVRPAEVSFFTPEVAEKVKALAAEVIDMPDAKVRSP